VTQSRTARRRSTRVRRRLVLHPLDDVAHDDRYVDDVQAPLGGQVAADVVGPRVARIGVDGDRQVVEAALGRALARDQARQRHERRGYLIALAREAPPPLFLVASVARLCAADPLYFLLGRAAGPAVMSAGRQVRGLRRLANRVPSRSSWLWLAAVAASPTAKTMLFAGGGGLPAVGVAAANVTGTLGRVLLVWRVGKAFPTLGETVAALDPWIAVPACVLAVAFAAVRCLAPRNLTAPGRECRPRAGRPGSAGVRCAG